MKNIMKKASASLAAIAVALSTVSAAGTAYAFGGVTADPAPTDKNDTALYWATLTSANWWESPGEPVLVGDELVYTCGTSLKALDKNTGKVLDKVGTLTNATSYGLTAPVYADGKIIVSEANGIVEAFDAETFETLWTYYDELGGQSNSELTYSDGYVYTGFWNSETAEANFVCVPVEDTDPTTSDEEHNAAWTYAVAGGFYWAGAYCTDTTVVVGTDDGQGGSTNVGSKVIAFDKAASISSGEAVVSSVADNLTGDIRTAISYDEDTDSYYVVSKGGFLYRFKLDSNGVISDVESLELPGAATSTPISANGRLYIGISGSGQFVEYSGHSIAVIDLASFKIVYTVATNGYPQSSALISDRDGENYVYFTANYTPGTVYVLHDNKTMTEPEKTETVTVGGNEISTCPVLFTPVGNMANYCLSTPITDEDGTLYFKNDSGYIMALGSKITSLKVEGKTLYKEGEKIDTDSLKVTAVCANGTEKDVTAYSEWGDLTAELEVGEGEISVSYDGMLYGDTDSETGHEYGAVYATLSYTVLSAEDYDSVEACVKAIADIGEVTAESGEKIETAEGLYNALSDSLKTFVENADVLTQARADYDALLDDSNADDENGGDDNNGENNEDNSGDNNDNNGSDNTDDANSGDDNNGEDDGDDIGTVVDTDTDTDTDGDEDGDSDSDSDSDGDEDEDGDTDSTDEDVNGEGSSDDSDKTSGNTAGNGDSDSANSSAGTVNGSDNSGNSSTTGNGTSSADSSPLTGGAAMGCSAVVLAMAAIAVSRKHKN